MKNFSKTFENYDFSRYDRVKLGCHDTRHVMKDSKIFEREKVKRGLATCHISLVLTRVFSSFC